MSIENAKKLVEKIQGDADLKAAFENDLESALASNDYGCSLEELKEALTLNKELDEKELESVSGGKAWGEGGCPSGDRGYAYYKENCKATVEPGSWCGSNDYCDKWDVTYTTNSHIHFK